MEQNKINGGKPLQEFPLSLQHQDLITTACQNLTLPLSEYNFCNLYLFRNIHHYSLLEISQDVYAIKGQSYKGSRFLMPLFHPENWSSLVQLATSLGVDYLFPITEDWWNEIKGYSIDISEDESDYLYDADLIRTCRGRHLSNHRNIVRQLLSSYDVETKKFTQEISQDAYTIIDTWAKEKKLEKAADIECIREGIVLSSQLGLEGWVYYANGQPAGCLFGQPLTQEIFVFHFSKVLVQYRGLARFMRQHTAQEIDPQYRYLNWEQDLGIPGLQRFKHSYRPIKLLKKGRLWVK